MDRTVRALVAAGAHHLGGPGRDRPPPAAARRRIFERAGDGREIDWGEITQWDPPHRLGYLWHLRRGSEAATDVLVHFEDTDGGSRIRIEHTGWARLGEEGRSWRDANRGGWAGLLPHLTAAAEQEG